MLNVKRTFFLDGDEVVKQREVTGKTQISSVLPHYELEDGTILWGQVLNGQEKWTI